MKPIFFFCLTMLIVTSANAQEKFTINGYITDAKTGEALIGATVYIKELKVGTATNSYGFYALSITRGNYTIVYSYLGYQSLEKPVEITKSQSLDIQMQEENFQLQ